MLWDLPESSSTFHATAGPSVNFCQSSVHPRDLHQLSMQTRNLPSTFMYFLSVRWNIRQFFEPPQDLPSIFCQVFVHCGTLHELSSTFHASAGPSDNIPWSHVTFHQLLPIFQVAARLSINFHQISVRLQGLSSTSVNFLCIRGTFSQLPSTFRASA